MSNVQNELSLENKAHFLTSVFIEFKLADKSIEAISIKLKGMSC